MEYSHILYSLADIQLNCTRINGHFRMIIRVYFFENVISCQAGSKLAEGIFSWTTLNAARAFGCEDSSYLLVMSRCRKWDTSIVSFTISALGETCVGHAFIRGTLAKNISRHEINLFETSCLNFKLIFLLRKCRQFCCSVQTVAVLIICRCHVLKTMVNDLK